jgi:hypothetical protein
VDWYSRCSPDSNPARLDHDEPSRECIATPPDEVHDGPRNIRSHLGRIPKKDDSPYTAFLRVDELPEVLMAGSAEGADNCVVTTLIG